MMFARALLFLATYLVLISSAKLTENLPADAPLRIGVKHKPQECNVVSEAGDQIKMHYTGTLIDGTKFDSSLDRGDPLDFKLGSGMVIKGWDEGLNNMCVGEKRRLTIPSGKAYGDGGSPPVIPPGATLIFEVEMMDIQKAKDSL